jgi:hypothetical protein
LSGSTSTAFAQGGHGFLRAAEDRQGETEIGERRRVARINGQGPPEQLARLSVLAAFRHQDPEIRKRVGVGGVDCGVASR